jgi:hypothetical protein
MRRQEPADLLFTAPRGGVLMLRNWRRRVFDPALAAAALGELTRTSSGTPPPASPVAAGANVKAVQRICGLMAPSLSSSNDH